MLQLTGRIALRVDIGELLELQGALQGHRIHQASAEEQGVVAVGKLLSQGRDAAVQRQGLFDLVRQLAQVGDQLGLERRDHAVPASEHGGQQGEVGQLGGERLGGGHPDFGARLGHQGQVRLPHAGARGHVAQGQGCEVADLLSDAQRRQGVRRLPGLGDGDEQAARRDHHAAVAELAGDIDLAGDADVLLDPVAGDAGGVEAGAAGDDGDALRLIERLGGAYAEGVLQRPLPADAPFQGAAQHLGLFEDLLLHVVAVVALAGVVNGNLHLDGRADDRLVLKIPHGDFIGLDFDQVALLQDDEAVGDRAQRQHVGGDVVLANALAHHQGAAHPGGDDAAGIVARHDGERVGALQPIHRRTYRINQGAPGGTMEVDEVGDGLGIRLRGKGVARLHQLGPQGVGVFDDAVVGYADSPVRLMGVSVHFMGRPVGGPTGVGDAGAAGQGGAVQVIDQIAHLSGAAAHLHRTARLGHDADSRRVVAPVLKPLQPLQQNGNDVAVRDRANQPAHGRTLPETSSAGRPTRIALTEKSAVSAIGIWKCRHSVAIGRGIIGRIGSPNGLNFHPTSTETQTRGQIEGGTPSLRE